MDRYIIREPRNNSEYPEGNQIITYLANAGGSNMIPPEIMYLNGPYASEFPYNQKANQGINVPHNINAQLNVNQQHNTNAQNNINAQYNASAQYNVNPQHSGQYSINQQPNVNQQQNNNPQMMQAQTYSNNTLPGQVNVSGIDPRYLSGLNDNSAQFIMNGQQMQKNTAPINSSFGSDYQNRSFGGIDRSKQKNFVSHPVSSESRLKANVQFKPQNVSVPAHDNKKKLFPQQNTNSMPFLKKPNELDLLKNDVQNQVLSRADRLEALQKSGPRAFSGPVEKVLKWHKSLQDIGILVFYEIVAKCVSVRPGDSCAKNLVVRDDNGPAMQIVYYEIDFMLPELKPPCTVRIIGRMMPGTCRLQAFNVRPATGADVATLPRRAAVAAHHVAKLCKEYGIKIP